MDVSTFLKGLKQTKNQRATHDTERDTTVVDVSSDTFSDGSEDSQHNDDDGDMIGGTHRAKRSASKYQGAKVAALFDPLQVVASNALTSSQPRASMDSVRARLVRPRQQDSAKRFREESVDFLRGELEKKRRVAERELIAPQESSIDVSEVDTALLDTIDSLLAENLKEGTSGHLDDTATFHNTGSSHEPPQDENAAETKDEEPASTNEPLPAPSKPKRRTTMFERATML